MNILDKIKQAVEFEARGVKSIYNGVKPFDQQGWKIPAKPQAVPYPLPAPPSPAPGILNLPLQGGLTGGLQRATGSLTKPLDVPIIFNKQATPSGRNYYPLSGATYDLLHGGWSVDEDKGRLKPYQPINNLPIYMQRIPQ